jgi:hypothetical protein
MDLYFVQNIFEPTSHLNKTTLRNKKPVFSEIFGAMTLVPTLLVC